MWPGLQPGQAGGGAASTRVGTARAQNVPGPFQGLLQEANPAPGRTRTRPAALLEPVSGWAAFHTLQTTSGPTPSFCHLLFTHILPPQSFEVSLHKLSARVFHVGQQSGRKPQVPRRAGPGEGAAASAPGHAPAPHARAPGPAGPYFSAQHAFPPSAK